MMRRLAAEALGTGLLIVAVIGSGIMAERLTQDVALQLLCNAVATGGALVALILIFAPVSGASFNPIVGIVGTLLGEGSWKDTALYAIAQTIGGCAGAVIANVMFDLDAVNLSEKVRTGSNIWISEAVASVGLLVVIYGTIRAKRANPAVTVARTLSNTFAGIAPESVPMFIVMQLVGAVIGFGIIRFVFEESAA